MNPAPLAPLAMSQTKEDLLKHLNMGLDTYSLMAKEVDRVYRWLTSEKRHLKKNCKRKPPYDWSDILENSKDEAMTRIAQSGDTHTSYYWNLAVPTEDCPNWIARWFLYHKFRYRDGRNRTVAKGGDRGDGKQSSRRSGGSSNDLQSESSTCAKQNFDDRDQSYQASSYYSRAETSDSTTPAYGYAENPATYSSYTNYPSSAPYQTSESYAYAEPGQSSNTSRTRNPYYDPVRDV